MLIQKISVGEPDEYNYMVAVSGTSLSISFMRIFADFCNMKGGQLP
nr:MAG TPA: hypothetical protein [Bacteriophage sp.]